MATVNFPGKCGGCGRQLPLTIGRGRVREFCDDTCRSRARREREYEVRRLAPPHCSVMLSWHACPNLAVGQLAEVCGAGGPYACPSCRTAAEALLTSRGVRFSWMPLRDDAGDGTK